MKRFNQVRKYGARLVAPIAATAMAAQVQAAALVIDTAEPIAQVTEGKTAAGAIGLAMLAFVVLVGVLVKVRRAGS